MLIVIADPDITVNLNPMLDSWEELGYIRNDKRDEITAMVKRRYGGEGSEERNRFAIKNTALFAMNLMLVAKGLGLDTHAIDGFDEEPMMVPMLIAVGYRSAKAKMLPRAFRRPFVEFVCFDHYNFENPMV